MKKLTVSLFLMFAAALSFGQQQSGSNMVQVTARHCQKYVHEGKVDQKACEADPSTVFYSNDDHNLRTFAGLDFSATQLGGAASATNVAIYVALSADATAPAQTDTVLAGELSTNNLGRAAAVYSHSACNVSACTFTLTKVFTDTGSSTSNIQKSAVFTQSAGGTMVYENTFPVVSLNVNDTLTVTWTVQLS